MRVYSTGFISQTETDAEYKLHKQLQKIDFSLHDYFVDSCLICGTIKNSVCRK